MGGLRQPVVSCKVLQSGTPRTNSFGVAIVTLSLARARSCNSCSGIGQKCYSLNASRGCVPTRVVRLQTTQAVWTFLIMTRCVLTLSVCMYSLYLVPRNRITLRPDKGSARTHGLKELSISFFLPSANPPLTFFRVQLKIPTDTDSVCSCKYNWSFGNLQALGSHHRSYCTFHLLNSSHKNAICAQ